MNNLEYTHCPFISIVIPTYNCASHIQEAIESALNQTYTNFELIVIDDGSTDNTKEIMSHYVTNHPDTIKYIYKRNGGVASARNTGIKKSRGQYIAFLDSDDYWDTRKLEETVQFINRYPGAGLLYTDFMVVDKRKNILWKNDRFHYNGNVLAELVEICFIGASTAVVRKNVFQKCGIFFEGYTEAAGCEDWDMWLRIAKNHEVRNIPKKLSCYRYRSGQYGFSEDFLKDYDLLLERLNLSQLFNERKIRKIYSSYHYLKGKRLMAGHKIRAARTELFKSFRLNPVSFQTYIMLLCSFLGDNILSRISRMTKMT